MTDPLGQSQVLPYLAGLINEGHHIELISFEKEDNFNKLGLSIKKFCAENKIVWHPLSYTKKPPLISTFYDVKRMQMKAAKLHSKTIFDIVHCRGYISAYVGLKLQKKGVKSIFDMRGFWADERKDGNIWNTSKWIYRQAYKFVKRLEIKLFNNSSYTVTLTENSKLFIHQHFKIDNEKIGVIPTCVDHKKFRILDQELNNKRKEELNLKGKTILLYSGSLGTESYDVSTLENAFSFFQNEIPNAFLLILTKDIPSENLKIDQANYRILSVSHPEVNSYLNIVDYGFIFYNSGWSNICRNPTKLGEYLATGLPTFALGDFGDIKDLAAAFHVQLLVNNTSEEWGKAISFFNSNKKTNFEIRSLSMHYYALERGIKFYNEIYKRI
jgi:glycosyltransferase involved in cell wall biosynthesis